jgi:hypothetical protein
VAERQLIAPNGSLFEQLLKRSRLIDRTGRAIP